MFRMVSTAGSGVSGRICEGVGVLWYLCGLSRSLGEKVLGCSGMSRI